MKYDANMVTLSEEEIKECKETLANNLVALRKMLYLSQTEFGNRTGISRIRLSMIECGKYEMTWSQFTSILFIFFMNRSTKQIIFRKKLFPDKLFAYLQCVKEGEATTSVAGSPLASAYTGLAASST